MKPGVKTETVKTKATERPEIRILTRGQMKKLRADGLDPALRQFATNKEAAAATTDLINWILDNIYPEFDFDDMPYNETVDIAMDAYRATYGTVAEEKN